MNSELVLITYLYNYETEIQHYHINYLYSTSRRPVFNLFPAFQQWLFKIISFPYRHD